jgi:hypothetical protein
MDARLKVLKTIFYHTGRPKQNHVNQTFDRSNEHVINLGVMHAIYDTEFPLPRTEGGCWRILEA